MNRILNALSVDVEDYFQVSAFSDVVLYESWEGFDRRVEANTRRLADLFEQRGVTATFFVLGWIAERHPALVRDLHASGHEIASHGYAHRTIDQCTPVEFREEIRRAKRLLEDIIQAPVIGFRAPSFSITERTRWALEILAEEGFGYDSSVFPVHHDRYGIPDAPRFPREIALNAGMLHEFPLSTLTLFGLPNLPIGGGGYLRIYPFWLTRWGLRRINRLERQPAIVYLHPWEIDPNQPRISAPRLSRWRHYSNLTTTARRIERLLGEFRFAPVRTVLGLSSERASDAMNVRDQSCVSEG